jgi:hypothetical protein
VILVDGAFRFSATSVNVRFKESGVSPEKWETFQTPDSLCNILNIKRYTMEWLKLLFGISAISVLFVLMCRAIVAGRYLDQQLPKNTLGYNAYKMDRGGSTRWQ